jgi:murein DD-endopeptidase MepM/ murein hydrolase activator NlpD
MNRTDFCKFRNLAQIAALLAITGCGTSQSPDRAAVEIKGSDPAATAPAAPAPVTAPLDLTPSAEGIVSYDGYQAAVARSGDTVASVAQRIGLSASELGAYNGLSPTHPLRPGDELVLPPKPGGYSSGAAPATVPQQTYELPQTGSGIAVADLATTSVEAAPIEAAPLQTGAADPAATGAPDASGGTAWSPDLAAAAIDRAAGFDEQGNLAAPPSAEEPLPAAPQEPVELASPQLRQYQTPSPAPLTPAPPARPIETIMTPAEEAVEDNSAIVRAATAPEPPVELRLIRPVVGPVVIGFNQGAGRAQNDGIDFASPANSPVVAAAAGEIALVSQSLGGLGNIVLVRHQGDYLTVYGRIEKVTVRKGDIVSQGQKIGVVSPATNPRMHFEVRQGADSLDPERFF